MSILVLAMLIVMISVQEMLFRHIGSCGKKFDVKILDIYSYLCLYFVEETFFDFFMF